MKKNKLIVIPFLAVLTSSGCSLMGIGQSSFSCPGMPEGIVCKSTTELYSLTDGNFRGETVPSVGNERGDDYNNSAEGYRVELMGGKPRGSVNHLPTRPMQAPGTGVQPVLEPAKVVRIWVGPWRDSQNNLIFPTYLYAQVEGRQWSVRGADFKGDGRVLTPMQVRSYGTETDETSNKGSSDR